MKNVVLFKDEEEQELGELITIDGRKLSDYSTDEIEEILDSDCSTNERTVLVALYQVLEELESAETLYILSVYLKRTNYDEDKNFSTISIVEHLYNQMIKG